MKYQEFIDEISTPNLFGDISGEIQHKANSAILDHDMMSLAIIFTQLRFNFAPSINYMTKYHPNILLLNSGLAD